MHLSKFTDYALRVLIYLGSRPNGFSTIDDIAKSYAISKEHLRKVVHHLSQRGWVESRRGRGGGLRLGRPSAQIVIGALVRDTEESLAVVECFERGRNQCAISGACRLAGMLDEALDAFLNVLDRYTLEDVLAGKSALLARLGLPAVRTGSEAHS